MIPIDRPQIAPFTFDSKAAQDFQLQRGLKDLDKKAIAAQPRK
jgi:hypothetical protein